MQFRNPFIRMVLKLTLKNDTSQKLLFLGMSVVVFAASGCDSEAGGHTDPVASVLLALIVILAAAKIGSAVFERLGQPAVLGELISGVILGNLILFNPSWSFFEPLRVASIQENWAVVIDSLARLGVIILLFEVGLESTVRGMMKVGRSSLLVAILGVIMPFVLGFGVSWLLIRELPLALAAHVPADFSLNYVHMFVGAVLCATSVGITARVFKDLGKLRTKEAQIILGAAVIDDVLGLIVLAVASAIIAAAKIGQSLELWAVFRLIGVAILFLGGSLTLGVYLMPKIMPQLARLRTSGLMLTSSLLFAFILAYLAHVSGLAAIVGAFAAGLILEEVHFKAFHEEITIEQLMKPVAAFLVPIFFVLMGIQVRLESFTNLSVLGVAGGITLAAFIGKQVCSLGVLEKGVDRLTVGVGMIPRGEVGLIFASLGKGLGIIDDATFSAIVIMVVATTLMTPPLLKITLRRWNKRAIEVSQSNSRGL
jgi:Kef-type K+ transport system membrane component KefB